MRIKNKRVKVLYSVLFILVIILLFLNLIDDNITGTFRRSISNNFLLISFLILVFVIYWKGYPFFEYDSDGEVITIRSSDPVIISRFSGNAFHIEFPKRKLISFSIKKGILRKKLQIKIKSKHRIINRDFSISYLNRKELFDLEKSLNKVITKNSNSVVNERG